MTILDSIVKQIEDNLGLKFGKDLFANHYPDSPDNILSVIDLGGLPPNKYTPTREKKIELKFRTKGYQEGVHLGNKLYELFHAFENYQMGDFFILSSYADTDVSYLYQDKQNRREFSIELIFLYKNY